MKSEKIKDRERMIDGLCADGSRSTRKTTSAGISDDGIRGASSMYLWKNPTTGLLPGSLVYIFMAKPEDWVLARVTSLYIPGKTRRLGFCQGHAPERTSRLIASLSQCHYAQ